MSTTITKAIFKKYVQGFEFTELFNELGWAYLKEQHPIKLKEQKYTLQTVAEKSGFRILVCNPDSEGRIPDYGTRKKLDSIVSKLFKEHLIIFTDQKKTKQLWQLVLQMPDQPSKLTETRWATGQEPELLYQRASGLIFTLDEEENITIVDVTGRVNENFHVNAEKITKKFYAEFKSQHKAFLGFIKGISDNVDKDWYASLMLNRLMFCYFIQKKGFLDSNRNYLSDKLKASREKQGRDKFYSFYRNFLLMLFHRGLGAPDRGDELQKEIGRIPYLNGGLFDEHELEKAYPDIDVKDEAFDRIFEFFDEWNWHLDTRELASGKDINPDVIGYIFEKYINDRAQMGAYYTKEDITDYIGKNCIIPYLFDELKRNYKEAFEPTSEIWQMLKNSGDKYIYAAVKHGVPDGENIWADLPDDIAAGIESDQPDLIEKRNTWNTQAPHDVALPTEIWREVIDRRKRYAELHAKVENGDIVEINDFITYNLDIRQFALDVIGNTNDPKVLKGYYEALRNVTVLDPTCGSGAFLFAAMNILEDLYYQCLTRMRGFVEDEDRLNTEDKKLFKNSFKYFREVLAAQQSEQHPNLEYFIYKTIILRNLYGVDIMREAVEIAKLRLFLKLVATVDVDHRKPNFGLEPLPDIDFNIRAGNSLIGFGIEKELQRGLTYSLDGLEAKPIIEEQCDVVAKTFERYKAIQLTHGDDYLSFREAKEDLNDRLKELNHELNLLLHKQYAAIDFDLWKTTHQPFHWFAEYYDIIKVRGGFDVIIGNPPYVEYSKAKKSYVIRDFATEKCGNLFGFVAERSKKVLSNKGYLSMIVPISSICTQRMISVQNVTFTSKTWISNYAERPSKLFAGAEVLLTIFIVAPGSEKTLLTTTFIKWKAEERALLFDTLKYNRAQIKPKNYTIGKVGFEIENRLFKKITSKKQSLAIDLLKNGEHRVFYRIGGGRYWKIFTDFSPQFKLNGQSSISSRENYLFTISQEDKEAAICILSSSLFYWYFIQTTNCRDLNPSDLKEFPLTISKLPDPSRKLLSKLCKALMDNYHLNSQLKDKVSKKTGSIIYQEFYPRLAKEIIDEIDTVLAEHYGFSTEELEFIINYDIKYRMGKDLEEEEEA